MPRLLVLILTVGVGIESGALGSAVLVLLFVLMFLFVPKTTAQSHHCQVRTIVGVLMPYIPTPTESYSEKGHEHALRRGYYQ